MQDKNKRQIKLSPAAERIRTLIRDAADGSQRGFARMVGCSQTVISRIVNGQQEPGRKLLRKIAQLAEVDDPEELLALLDPKTQDDLRFANHLPVANRLLDAPPESRPAQLTAINLAVPADTHRRSRYAIEADKCFGDRELREHLMDPADLIVIEASPQLIRRNAAALSGRLCVIASFVDGCTQCTLCRPSFESGTLMVDSPSEDAGEVRANEHSGRVLDLVDPLAKPDNVAGKELAIASKKPADHGTVGKEDDTVGKKEVSIDQVVGLAISMTRTL
ncbi:MAG: helix-turn-helix transcriptional regulator [Planctomycetaceae bacterium]